MNGNFLHCVFDGHEIVHLVCILYQSLRDLLRSYFYNFIVRDPLIHGAGLVKFKMTPYQFAKINGNTKKLIHSGILKVNLTYLPLFLAIFDASS